VGGALAVPLAGGDGVEAPVDEHAESGLAPPLHAGVALGGGFGVLDGGNGMIDGSGVGGCACELRVAERGRDEKKDGGDAAEGLFQGSPPIGFCCRGIVCEKGVLQVKIV